MKTYSQTNNIDLSNIDGRVLRRILRQLQMNGVPTRRTAGFDACGTPTRTSVCTENVCKPDILLSCETKQARLSANRTAYYNLPTGGLAAGSTSTAATFASVPAVGALDYFSLLGQSRTVYLTDLVSTLSNLDTMLVIVSVAGVVRFSLNGGRFSRANANTSTGACGLYVCAGALEAIQVVVYNQSAAAFLATDTAHLETRTVWDGEPGFMCTPCTPAPDAADCSCGTAGASAGFDPGEVG